MASSLTNLLFHIVFSTKERVPLIDENLRQPLYEYIGGILRGQRSILLEIGGMPDHVHLLVKLKADLAVATAVRLRFRERVSGSEGPQLYPEPGGASRSNLIPGGIDDATQEAPHCV